ncbi:MAG: hypothetical protein WC152_07445, partial [Candidatus Izemoplasmatales bacterium]
MKRFLITLLLITLIFFGGSLKISALYQFENLEQDLDIEDTFDISDFRNSTYVRTLNHWLEDYDYVSLDERVVKLEDFLTNNPDIDITRDSTYKNDYSALL